jgi:hypothetical protein
MWQEEIQNGATWTWSDFLQAVQKGDPSKPGASRKFWRQQRTHVIARRWADVVGKEHFTVVTVPPAGSPSHILLDRFSSVLGVDPSGFAPPLRRNQSIGVASALVLRALNERLENDPLPNAKYQKFVKTRLAKNGLAGRASQEPSAGLDASWVRKRSEQAISRLRELDVAVVGDLAELRPAKVPGVDPSTVGEGEQLDAALDGLVHLISMWSRS